MIANIITFSRILFSLFLLFISPHSVIFTVFYLLCGLTDVLDGFLARRLHTESKTGERLDSAADLFFAAVYALRILPLLSIPWWMRAWVGIIAVVKGTFIIDASRKAHRLSVAHSFGNRLTGLLLFIIPLLPASADVGLAAAIVCIAASAEMIREMADQAEYN